MEFIRYISVGTTCLEWLTVLAILFSPMLAVGATRFVDERRDAKKRKMEIFRTLMRTRAERLAYEHVGSLNLIELEFYRDKDAVKAYKDYISHLHEPYPSEDNEQLFLKKRDSLYHEMLFQLGKVLRLNFDKGELQDRTYSPRGWANDQNVQRLNGQLLNELLSGSRALPIEERPPA